MFFKKNLEKTGAFFVNNHVNYLYQAYNGDQREDMRQPNPLSGN